MNAAYVQISLHFVFSNDVLFLIFFSSLCLWAIAISPTFFFFVSMHFISFRTQLLLSKLFIERRKRRRTLPRKFRLHLLLVRHLIPPIRDISSKWIWLNDGCYELSHFASKQRISLSRSFVIMFGSIYIPYWMFLVFSFPIPLLSFISLLFFLYPYLFYFLHAFSAFVYPYFFHSAYCFSLCLEAGELHPPREEEK